jgi:hypothetical protein
MGSDLTQYQDPAGWRLSYPRGMHVEHSSWAGSAPLSEVTIASFAIGPPLGSTGNLGPPRGLDGIFPEGAVALRIVIQDGYPRQSLSLDEPESSFPIRLATFEAFADAVADVPPAISRVIHANGQRYRVIAWISPDADEASRGALDSVVASLSFPHLQPGAVLSSGFVVLEAQDAYPLGSFTRIDANGRPLYLVRAPGGFYALGWQWSGPRGGYRETCEHRADEVRAEIFCSDCSARWDRIGRVLVRPPSAHDDDPLHLSVAKVAWDGHVIVHPRTHQAGSDPVARRFWPEWHPG